MAQALSITSYLGQPLTPRPRLALQHQVACGGVGCQLYEFPWDFDRLPHFSVQNVLERCRFDNGQTLSSAPAGSNWSKAHSFWIKNVSGDQRECRAALIQLEEKAPYEVGQLGDYLYTVYQGSLPYQQSSSSHQRDVGQRETVLSSVNYSAAKKIIIVVVAVLILVATVFLLVKM